MQRNLLLSHAIGVGASFPTEVVRGMLLLRAQSLAQGYSGVRPVVIDYLLTFLNEGVHPVVPSQGSVGASGDLAPLAHMSLPLIGEGGVEYRGEIRASQEVLDMLGLEPLVLEAKEGLALINGTQAMASMLALLVWDAQILLKSADIAAAMSVEARKASHRPFDEAVSKLRPHPGATTVAEKHAPPPPELRDSGVAYRLRQGARPLQPARRAPGPRRVRATRWGTSRRLSSANWTASPTIL